MNDYVMNYWKKVDTPFLDEVKDVKTYTFLFDPSKYISKEGSLEEAYFEAKDKQKTLISKYICTDQSQISRGKFFYQIFPCFVTSYLPNSFNFPVDMITPDLSKEYQEEEKTFKSMKVKRKTYNYLSTIECATLEDDMLVIWIIMWRMCFKFIPQEEEKAFRVDQLCGILHRHLKNNKKFKKALLLFEEVLNVILKHGNLSMVKQVLKLMKYLQIKRNSTIDNIFFMAIRKKREILSRMEEVKADGSHVKISEMIAEIEGNHISVRNFRKWDRSLDSSKRETIVSKKLFMRRTFKSGKDVHNFMIKDIISMSADAY